MFDGSISSLNCNYEHYSSTVSTVQIFWKKRLRKLFMYMSKVVNEYLKEETDKLNVNNVKEQRLIG